MPDALLAQLKPDGVCVGCPPSRHTGHGYHTTPHTTHKNTSTSTRPSSASAAPPPPPPPQCNHAPPSVRLRSLPFIFIFIFDAAVLQPRSRPKNRLVIPVGAVQSEQSLKLITNPTRAPGSVTVAFLFPLLHPPKTKKHLPRCPGAPPRLGLRDHHARAPFSRASRPAHPHAGVHVSMYGLVVTAK